MEARTANNHYIPCMHAQSAEKGTPNGYQHYPSLHRDHQTYSPTVFVDSDSQLNMRLALPEEVYIDMPLEIIMTATLTSKVCHMQCEN